MKSVTDLPVSRAELEHIKHVLRVYGLTGQFVGVQRLFVRRQAQLLAKIEDALSRTRPLPKSRPNKERVAIRERRMALDNNFFIGMSFPKAEGKPWHDDPEVMRKIINGTN